MAEKQPGIMIRQALRDQHKPKINQCGVDIQPSGEVTDARIPDLVTRQAASINTAKVEKQALFKQRDEKSWVS